MSGRSYSVRPEDVSGGVSAADNMRFGREFAVWLRDTLEARSLAVTDLATALGYRPNSIRSALSGHSSPRLRRRVSAHLARTA